MLIPTLLILGVKLGYVLRDRSQRLVEVPSVNMEGFISRYLNQRGLSFPENITNIEIAKTGVIDDSIHYVIKFETEQYRIDLFIKGLKEICNGHLLDQEYSKNIDFRKDKPHIPKWFLTEIKKGRVLTTLSSNMLPISEFDMCVDESKDQKSIVYISCWVYK